MGVSQALVSGTDLKELVEREEIEPSSPAS